MASLEETLVQEAAALDRAIEVYPLKPVHKGAPRRLTLHERGDEKQLLGLVRP